MVPALLSPCFIIKIIPMLYIMTFSTLWGLNLEEKIYTIFFSLKKRLPTRGFNVKHIHMFLCIVKHKHFSVSNSYFLMYSKT